MNRRVYSNILVIVLMILCIVLLKKAEVNAQNNNDPMLKAIKINGEDINPEFDMFKTEYVLLVNENTEKIKIEAIPDDINAKVDIIGDENLKNGRNEFEIRVTAEDGVSKQNYYVYITKGDISKSNANLKNLKIGSYELAPSFEKNIINYVFEYPSNLQSVEIEAIPEDEGAKVEIIGNESLKSDFQNIEIKVTAKDEETVKTYYLIAKKTGVDVENDPQKEENEDEYEYENVIIDSKNNENKDKIIIYLFRYKFI